MGSESSPRRESSDHSAEPAVELLDVTKRYGSQAAVDDISLAVKESEFFTLVGPSGCGKTTTLRLIGGFEPPDDGVLRLAGNSLAGVAPEDRNLAVVFQSYALFPHMTVGENVAYGLKFAEPPGGVSRHERVSELLALVDLAGMESRDPETLSGGQQQRVALARALAPGPDVLLLDEPMSALDAQLRQKLRVQLKTIQRELGVTTIYVTHDQEEALAISDRVAVMADGHIEQIGTPEEIYYRPKTRFVADFIGDNNVFSGRLDRVGTDTAEVVVADTRFTVGWDDDSPPNLRADEQVSFCVRPEQFTLAAAQNQLTVDVTSSEFLGASTRIHTEWSGHELLVTTEHPIQESLVIGFEPTAAHIIPTSG